MNVAPATAYESVIETGITGLVGTIKLGLYDNVGGTTDALSTTGIIETPAGSGIYAATRTSPATLGEYTLVWSLDGTTSPDQVATDSLVVTSNAPGDAPTGDTYVTRAELIRVLKLRNVTDEQDDALDRCLLAAAGEINSEIDLPEGNDLAGWQLALAAEVNLERAVEHWQQGGTFFGIMGIDDRGGTTYAAKDSFERHALKLAPLKARWGVA